MEYKHSLSSVVNHVVVVVFIYVVVVVTNIIGVIFQSVFFSLRIKRMPRNPEGRCTWFCVNQQQGCAGKVYSSRAYPCGTEGK